MRFLSFILIFSLLLCGCGVNKDDITSSSDSDVAEDSQVLPELTVIFGDVGKADFILLSCGGEYAVIDAGYKKSYDYIEKTLHLHFSDYDGDIVYYHNYIDGKPGLFTYNPETKEKVRKIYK